MPKIEIDPDLCTKCGTCVTNCPVGIFNQEDDDFPQLKIRRTAYYVACVWTTVPRMQ